MKMEAAKSSLENTFLASNFYAGLLRQIYIKKFFAHTPEAQSSRPFRLMYTAEPTWIV